MIHEKSSSIADLFMPTATLVDQSAQDEHAEGNTLDDIFGLSASDADDNAQSQAPPREPSEIPRVRSTHVTNGYRDGITESKARFVQEGFDEGYSLGAVIGLKAGWLLGVADGFVNALGQRRLRRRDPSITTPKLESSDAREDLRLEQREQLEQKRGKMLTEAQKALATARKELALDSLFSRDYFGEDGIWIYSVAGKEEETTFREVANAHPLIQRWTAAIHGMADSWEVNLTAAAKMNVSGEDG